MSDLETIINEQFDNRTELEKYGAGQEIRDAIEEILWKLDSGQLRIAEKMNGKWHVHQWLKKAVLLSFIIDNNIVIQGGHTNYFDKIPNKFYGFTKAHFIETGTRVVPTATVRRGSFI